MTKVRDNQQRGSSILQAAPEASQVFPVDDAPSAIAAAPSDVFLPKGDPRRAQTEIALATAEDDYAYMTAMRRSSNLATFVEGGRWHQSLQRVLHPWAFRRALAEYQANEHSRLAYKEALHGYLGALGLQDIPQAWEVKELQRSTVWFETRVLEYQAQLAEPERERSLQLWIADRWMEWGKGRRAAVIAAPALLLGLGAGSVAAVLGLPVVVLTGAGVGTAAAGRYVGGYIAKAVNRRRAFTEVGFEQLRSRAAARLDAYYEHYANEIEQRPDEGIRQTDITVLYEAGTKAESRENARRLHLAQALGGLAAGVGFAAANTVMHSPQIAQAIARQAHTQSVQHSSHTIATIEHTPVHQVNVPQPPVTHVVPPSPPAGLAHEYPWTAATQWNSAHHLGIAAGNVWDTLHHAAAAYNQVHSTDFRYVLHSNGTWLLQDGARQLTPGQLADFNTFMWRMAV